MRRLFLGLAVVLGMLALAPSRGQAQLFGGGDAAGDPFFLYYGFYLPRQAALSVRSRPDLLINEMAAVRQQSAQTERAGLYDPASPFGSGEFDPARPFGDRTAGRRAGAGVASLGSSVNGSGPPLYYNRSAAYYPGLRTGRGSYAGGALGGGRQRVGMPGMAPYASSPIGYQMPRTR